MEDHLSKIRTALREGRFTSEASVSQGIVLPTLHALGWPVFDTSIVTPEFSVEGRRVDYALCHPANRPAIFIEVKRVGLAEGADRQLFEYAFHLGVPMAILTDGQEWSFYLPGEQGHYAERRVYKIDLLEREVSESSERLKRYLGYSSTCDGTAIQAARSDYRNVARGREIQATLPEAWGSLIREQDSLLLELLADKVEDICGYRPELDVCAAFLQSAGSVHLHQPTEPIHKPAGVLPRPEPEPWQQKSPRQKRPRNQHSFSVLGQSLTASSARDVMTTVFRALAEDDSQFLERFAARKHGKKRRYLSRSKSELYPGRPDLVESAALEILPGWWIGTNYSRRDIQKIIELAKEVARPEVRETFDVQVGD